MDESVQGGGEIEKDFLESYRSYRYDRVWLFPDGKGQSEITLKKGSNSK